MKMALIYPRWPKLDRQTEFHLPPHGPVVFAAALPVRWRSTSPMIICRPSISTPSCDLVAISTMLSSQLPRAFEIAREFRARGKKVIFGGIATMLHAEEVQQHADAVFLGEVEGRMAQVIEDSSAVRSSRSTIT